MTQLFVEGTLCGVDGAGIEAGLEFKNDNRIRQQNWLIVTKRWVRGGDYGLWASGMLTSMRPRRKTKSWAASNERV